MSYNDVQAQFLQILNRDDCTPALAQTFLTQALSQIERDARLPCMERTVTATNTGGPLAGLSIPSDFLEPIDLMVRSAVGHCYVTPAGNAWDTWFPLRHRSYRQLLGISSRHQPTSYARNQGQFMFAGWIPANVPVQLLYYGQFTPITDPTMDNEATLSIPDLMIYKALGTYAGTYFEHPNAAAWEATYQMLLGSANQLAQDAEWNGGPMEISAAYGGHDDGTVWG